MRGILIYILNKWNAQCRANIETGSIETICLEITLSKTKSYAYRPPNASVSWFEDFNTELERAASFDYDVVLTGDFNVDLCNTDSHLTQHVQDITQLNNLSQIVNEYTHITTNTQTLIDHIYVNNINHVQEKWPKLQ